MTEPVTYISREVTRCQSCFGPIYEATPCPCCEPDALTPGAAVIRFQVVVADEEGRLTSHFYESRAALIESCTLMGYEHDGEETNPRGSLRPELAGNPKFSGLIGPCWNANGVRYEDYETYRQMSA